MPPPLLMKTSTRKIKVKRLKMKNRLRYILLLPLFLLLLNTSYGQKKYTTDEVNKTMCRTWRFYTFDPDSTGKFFRFDYVYILIGDFTADGKVAMHYPDNTIQGSWKWDEANQLISISTSPDIAEKANTFMVLQMNDKKCTFQMPSENGKGAKLFLLEGAK